MIRRLLYLLPALALALAACDLEIHSPRTDLNGLPTGLAVDFAVEPGEVGQHAPFTARLSVTNTTSDTVRVVTGHGCLAIAHLLRNGKRIPFQGSNWACTAAITTHTFAPGEAREVSWPMRAELYAEYEGDVDGAPAPKGSYIVQASFGTGPSVQKPVVEAVLRVK